MKKSVTIAGLVGLMLFAGGIAVALTSGSDRARAIACAVMVTGLITVVIASFSWASDPATARPRARTRPSRRSPTVAISLHHRGE